MHSRNICALIVATIAAIFIAFAPPVGAAAYLEYNTQQTILVGPFLDYSDGVTPKTGIDISSGVTAISCEGVSCGDISNNTWSHVSSGFYSLTLDASDCNTYGRLIVSFSDPDSFVPVWHEFEVVPTNVYDSYYSTDKLEVDVQEIGGVAYGTALASEADIWGYATRTLTAIDEDDTTIDLDGSAVGSVTGAVGSVTGAVGSVTGNVGGIAGTIQTFDALDATLETAPTNFSSLDINASGQVDVYQIEGGDATDALATGAGAALTSYDPPTNAEMEARTLVAASYFDPAADTVANVTTVGSVTGNVGGIAGTVNDFDELLTGLDDSADVADAVWDEASTGHTDAGKAGQQLWTDVDAILEDTATIDTDAEIAGAVWDALYASYSVTDSFGELIGDQPTVSDLADAVWDEDVVAAHDTADTSGYILEVLQGKLPTNYIMGSSVQTAKDDEVDAILVDTGTTLDDYVDELETRLTATRAGYLDNLNSLATDQEIATAVWATDKDSPTADSYGWVMNTLLDVLAGRMKIDTSAYTMTWYDYDSDTTPSQVFYLYDSAGAYSTTNVYERDKDALP